jgi:hypothetical protein
MTPPRQAGCWSATRSARGMAATSRCTHRRRTPNAWAGGADPRRRLGHRGHAAGVGGGGRVTTGPESSPARHALPGGGVWSLGTRGLSGGMFPEIVPGRGHTNRLSRRLEGLLLCVDGVPADPARRRHRHGPQSRGDGHGRDGCRSGWSRATTRPLAVLSPLEPPPSDMAAPHDRPSTADVGGWHHAPLHRRDGRSTCGGSSSWQASRRSQSAA